MLTSRQVSPATALPGQTFDTTLAITNTGSVTATQVLVQERFTNTTPTSATATFAAIAPSSSASTTFAQTAPALAARSAGESQPDYLARLAAADGLRLRANGTISYAALSGQAYPPLNVVSATGLSLPRLVLGLSAPACVGPGSQIAYIVRVANLGSAPATNAGAQISFPDGSTASLALGTIAAGGVVNQTRTWAVPTIAARQTSDPADEDPAEGETSAAYLDRLRAADGTQLSAHVSLDWQDSRGTAYGSLAQQIASTERVPILTLTPQIPTTLVPGQTAQLQFSVVNSGGGNAGSVQVQVANPDGTQSVATTPAIPAGETRILQTSWAVPTAEPKGAAESDADYQARLAIFDTSVLHFGMLLSWADAATNPYGITSANAQSATPVPIVPISMEGPSSAQAGSTITYTIHLINNGYATVTALDLRLTTITGSTQMVASGGPLVPGEQRQFSVPFTIPSSQPGGSATAVARVTWQDSGSNSYGPLSAQVTTSISALATPTPTVAPTATPAPSPLDGATLTLAPSSAGPNVTGTQQQMTATLKDRFGAPLAGVSISFVVSGPNATSASATTNAAGMASFSYTVANNGTDTIQATATSGSVTLVSNTASVGWVTPVQQISTTTVWGRFFFDGQLKQQTQPDGTTRQYTYDWRGNPLTETDEAGNVTRYQYDLAGNVTRYQYDLAGELIATTRADGTADAATERYDYDLAGRKIGETDGDNNTTQIQYDAADRIRFVIDPVHGATHPTEYRYDDAGRMVRMIDVRGIQTQYTYDQRRFPSQITYAFGTPDAQIERQTHDGRGNLLRVTDRNEKTTTYTYDADDRLETVTDALDHTTRYSRDRWGNVLTITDANSHQTSFTYDALGRVTQKTWPDDSTERYTYDEQIGSTPATSFSKISHQLADGNINTTYYDAQGRVSRADYFDGETARYVYTPTGMPQEVLDQRGTTCYSYDDQDRVVDISYLGSGPGLVCGQSPARQRVGYAYDDIGNRVGMTMASGGTTRTLSYAYDANDRLCSISTAATPTPCGVTNSSTFAYSYDDQARTRRLTYPNGIVATSTYDPFNHLRSLQQTLSGQVPASYTYTLDAVGNRTRLDEGDGSVTTWEYDDTYRLRREQRQAGGSNPPSGSSWDTRYTYDAVGNRLTKTDVSGATSAATSYSYRPNGLDQIDHITLPSGSQLPYSYDQRGNLLSDGVATYSYNAHDLLSGVAVGGHSRSYSYDAKGTASARRPMASPPTTCGTKPRSSAM